MNSVDIDEALKILNEAYEVNKSSRIMEVIEYLESVRWVFD